MACSVLDDLDFFRVYLGQEQDGGVHIRNKPKGGCMNYSRDGPERRRHFLAVLIAIAVTVIVVVALALLNSVFRVDVRFPVGIVIMSLFVFASRRWLVSGNENRQGRIWALSSSLAVAIVTLLRVRPAHFIDYVSAPPRASPSWNRARLVPG